MLMYNLLESRDNYFMTSGSFQNYYRDKINDDYNNTTNNNINRFNNNKTITSKFFKCKTKVTGSTPDNEKRLNAEVVFPLKQLSNFWISLDMPLINFEIELDFS